MKYSEAIAVINNSVLSETEMLIIESAVTEIAEVFNIPRFQAVQRLHSEAIRIQTLTEKIREDRKNGFY